MSIRDIHHVALLTADGERALDHRTRIWTRELPTSVEERPAAIPAAGFPS